MNPVDDPTTDELSGRLDHLATTIRIRPGSLDAVRARGAQRIQRRRSAIAGLSAAAVVGVSITGIVVLSRPTAPTVADRSADPAASAGEALPFDATATTAPIAGSATVSGSGGGSVDEPPVATATSASVQLVEPALTWTTVRPDSTQALAYPYALSGVLGARAPLYAFSSAPGRDDGNGAPPTLYRSDDGISWTAVDPDTLPEHTSVVGSLATEEDTPYVVSTAPSTAAGAPPNTVAATTDTGMIGGGSGSEVLFSTRAGDGSWTSTVVPLDAASWLDVPGVLAATPMELSASSIDRDGQGAVAVIGRAFLSLDTSAVSADPGSDSVQILPDGVEVSRFDEACAGVATTIVLPIGEAGTTGTPVVEEVLPDTTVGAVAVDPVPCSESTVDHYELSDLGVDQRALDEYFGPPHLFVSTDDGSFVEVPFPASAESGHVVSGARLLALGDQHALLYDELDLTDYSLVATRLWLSADGERWEERTLPAGIGSVWGPLALGRLADGRLAGVAGQTAEPWHPIVFVDDGAGGWTTVDLAGALGAADGRSATLSLNGAAIGDGGLTVAAMVTTDPLVEGGPVSAADGDRTVSLIDSMGTYVVSVTATGEEVARFRPDATDVDEDRTLRYDTNGDLVLADAATGEEIARVPIEIQQQLNDAAFGTVATPQTLVLHSSDGVAWSRESLQDLGAETANWVSSVTTVGGRVLVTYIDSGSRNGDGTPSTFVLVGTPDG